MWQSLHDAWWRLATQNRPSSLVDQLACGVLSACSGAYRSAVALRNRAFDLGWIRQARLPCGVVSVGSLTVGGAGKTTCVELIAQKLAAGGRKVAVLTRGYGGPPDDYWLRCEDGRLLLDGRDAPDGLCLADEAQVLARRLPGIPVVVGSRRSRTGRLACEAFQVETVVLDDGFQHRHLARDCDIVLVHVRTPLGGWAMLPRGPMREPLSALRRAHVVMITKVDESLETMHALQERLRAVSPGALCVTAVHEPAGLLDVATGAVDDPKRLEARRVGLVSSIGDPGGFDATVRRLGAAVVWHRAFPDHYPYHASDWEAVAQQIRTNRPDLVVTTQKDWVRLEPIIGRAQPPEVPLQVLGVRLRIVEGARELDDRLARVFTRQRA